MVEHFRIQVQFPNMPAWWIDVRVVNGSNYFLTLPGEGPYNLEFAGGWGKDARLELWAPDGSHFVVRGDWYWLDYYDAYLKRTYAVPILIVEDPDPDPELEEGYQHAMQTD